MAIVPAGGMTAAERASLLSVESSHAAELGVSASLTNPALTPMLSGQFTPQRSTVLLDVDISHALLESAGAHVSWHLYYGPVGSVLTKLAQGDALAAGVAQKRIGKVGALAGGTHGSFKLDGLTPGTPVAYEVSAGVTGGAGVLALGKTPSQVAVSQQSASVPSGNVSPGYPQPKNTVAALNTDSTVSLVRAQHEFALDDVLVSAVTLPAAGQRIAITPDGTRAVATTAGHQATVITTGAVTGSAPAVQGSYTVPGTTPAPNGVECSPDGVYAWIANITTKTLVRCTLATGVMGSAIALGTAGTGAGASVAVSPDGAYVYVAVNTSTTGEVVKVRTSDQTVVGTCTVANLQDLAVAPDGLTVWAITRSGVVGTLVPVNAAAMTAGASTAIGVRPFRIAIFPDGRGCLVASDTVTAGEEQIQHFLLPDAARGITSPSLYVEWVNQLGTQAANNAAYDVAINQNGCIYVTSFARSALNIWLGGKAQFTVGSDYWADELRVRVQHAAA